MTTRKIVVFGGSGFIGRQLVAQLVRQGETVVVPTRKREHARELLVLPGVEVVETAVLDPASLSGLLAGAQAVYYLVGILHERRPGDFRRAHVDLLNRVLDEAARQQVGRFIHLSALRANSDGPSEYLRSKAQGEAAVRSSAQRWTIFQPSVVFGPGDLFLNLFARLMRWSPVVPLAAPKARFQPIYVGDLATCLVRALHDRRCFGQTYTLCGPKVYSLLELAHFVATHGHLRRWIVGLGPSFSAIQAAVFEILPGKLLTRDNLRSMERDNICECDFPSVFALRPASLEQIVPSYLGAGAKADRFEGVRGKRLCDVRPTQTG